MDNLEAKPLQGSESVQLRGATSMLATEEVEVSSVSHITKKVSGVEESLTTSDVSTDENYTNQTRLMDLKRKFTKTLMTFFCDQDFEYGVETRADVLVKEKMAINTLATKEWLNSIFVEYFGNPSVIAPLLRVIARIEYVYINPVGPTMAVAALSHKDVQVQECGVRAFESWASPQSLHVLQNLKSPVPWLQEYINQVVADLTRDLSASVR
jgi:hypothetical protein